MEMWPSRTITVTIDMPSMPIASEIQLHDLNNGSNEQMLNKHIVFLFVCLFLLCSFAIDHSSDSTE
jgi:hypothetical protein